MLRIGRTLAYTLARRYEETGGLEGLPVIRLGNCLRVPRWALLELALNGRTVPLGELMPAASESRRRLDAELVRISRLGHDAEHRASRPRAARSRTSRTARAVRPTCAAASGLAPSSSCASCRPPEESSVFHKPRPSLESSKAVQTGARERAGVVPADAAGDDPPRGVGVGDRGVLRQYFTAAPARCRVCGRVARQRPRVVRDGDVEALELLLSGRDPGPARRWAGSCSTATRADGRVVRGGVGVRCDVLGAEVAVGVVGTHRRRAAARGARRRRCRQHSSTWSGSGRRPASDRTGPTAPGHTGPDDGHVPSDHLARRRSADPHPRRDLGQGADRRRALAGVGRPVPEAPPADARRPVPVGAARRAHPPLAVDWGPITTDDGTVLLVEPFAGDRLEDNCNPVGRMYYAGSTAICTPNSLSQEVGRALGAQAGEAQLRQVFTEAGFTHFRRATETPFKFVFEAKK